MIRHRGDGEFTRVSIISILAGLLLSGLVQAGPVGIPDSARPGAVRPEQESVPEESRPPPVDVVDVPPVIDRPFDVAECPCVIVNKFRLLNAGDMPEYNVKLADVQAILDEQLQQQPESGYSIGQMQEVGNVVRNYYREKGLILTQVVVPVQTIEGGVVDLELYVGTLGRVLAEGNEIYSREVLETAFTNLIGKPIVKSEIEAALLRLTDFPGLTVFGVFQPGQLIGTADIVLKVQEEKRFDVAMRVDNHGSEATGPNRFRTVIDWNNVTDGADKLSLTAQQSYQPKNSFFYTFSYERFLSDSYKAKFSIDRNKFDVGGALAAQGISGRSQTYRFGLEKTYIRSRLRNLLGRVELNLKKSTTDTAGEQVNKNKTTNLIIGVDYDSVDTFSFTETGGGINFATLEWQHGFNNLFGSMGSNADLQNRDIAHQPSRVGGSGKFASGQYSRLFLSYTRLQTLIPGQNLLFRFEWQYSDDLLLAQNQYSMGGPDNVRAFTPGQQLWDKALFYSFEWLINAPFIADQPAFENRKWGEVLQFGVFYDFAVGKLNDPLETEQQGFDRYDGAGVGLRFNVPGSIDSRLFWAWEIGHDPIGNDRRPQIWGDFTYSF